jgi:hypothetical protein
MPKVEKWEKKIAWIVSSFLGVIIVATACITLQGSPLFDEYLFQRIEEDGSSNELGGALRKGASIPKRAR